MKNANSPTGPRRITTAERRKVAVNLRVAGATFTQIGDQLGVSRQAAHQMVTKALDELAAQVSESADQLRAIELHRLDAMTAALWSGAMSGDEQKIDRVIKLMNRRAAMLGLDRPVKFDVTNPTLDEKINAELKRLGIAPKD